MADCGNGALFSLQMRRTRHLSLSVYPLEEGGEEQQERGRRGGWYQTPTKGMEEEGGGKISLSLSLSLFSSVETYRLELIAPS